MASSGSRNLKRRRHVSSRCAPTAALSPVSKKPKIRPSAPKPPALWKPYPKLQITVIDEHNDALLPIWKALKSKKMPKSGVKLMHWDSHPDMGCLDTLEEGKAADKKMLASIHRGRFNEEEVHEATCIATYIPVLVLQGVVNEVTWVAGSWCDQMDEGSYDLIVGRCKKTGIMKVAGQGPGQEGILKYYRYDGACATKDELDLQRPWKCHVVKFGKDSKFSDASLTKLVSLFSEGEWILDIDEDYLSCNNPYEIEWRANFGDESYERLKKVYYLFDGQKLADKAEEVDRYSRWWKLLEKATTDKLYKLDEGPYLQHPQVQELIGAASSIMTTEAAEDVLREYREVCLAVFPRDADPVLWNCEDFYGDKDIVGTGEMCTVPHHVSTVTEILSMLNDTEKFLAQIKRPLLATVATSRADRYLPDPQADFVNTMTLRMLRRRWAGATTTRKDKPDNTAEDRDDKSLDYKRLNKPARHVPAMKSYKAGVPILPSARAALRIEEEMASLSQSG